METSAFPEPTSVPRLARANTTGADGRVRAADVHVARVLGPVLVGCVCVWLFRDPPKNKRNRQLHQHRPQIATHCSCTQPACPQKRAYAITTIQQHPRTAPQTPRAPSRQCRKCIVTNTTQNSTPKSCTNTSTPNCMLPSTRTLILHFFGLLEVRTSIAFGYLGNKKLFSSPVLWHQPI